jgi:hypothetical protein
MELQQQAGDHLYNHKKSGHAPKPEGEVETQCRFLHFAGMKMQYQAKPGFTALSVISILVQIGIKLQQSPLMQFIDQF